MVDPTRPGGIGAVGFREIGVVPGRRVSGLASEHIRVHQNVIELLSVSVEKVETELI